MTDKGKRGVTRGRKWIIGLATLILTLGLGVALSLSPVEAVQLQVEHEYGAGRMTDEARDKLLFTLKAAQQAYETGDTETYRIHVHAFEEDVNEAAGRAIDSDAAKRILSVAAAL